MRISHRVKLTMSLLIALLALPAACTTGSDEEAPGASAAAETADLPGDEVLQPPTEEPATVGLAESLAELPSGSLTGHIVLTLTGTAVFDEGVVGTCSPGKKSTLRVSLADGSEVVVEADSSVAGLSVTAPGLEFDRDLADVQIQRDGSEVTLEAELLQAGTSESAGSIWLVATCG